MERKYNGGLTREQFLFFETKILAELLTQGYSQTEAIDKIVAENLFQFPTERMIKSIAISCAKRLNSLESDELIRCLARSSSDVGKQINLYAMARQNGIVYDFLVTVVGEKFQTLDFSFSRIDIDRFMLRLQEQNDAVARWSGSTIKKIKQVLRKCLVECDYLNSANSEVLNPVYLYPELENVIRANGDTALFPAFNYFE